MRKFLLVAITLSLISFLGFFLYPKVFKYEIINSPEIKVEEEKTDNLINEEEPKIEKITYEEKPAKLNAKYFEKVVKVKDQYLYLAFPITITKDLPPTLILYSHGSNTTVSKDFSDPFMKDMQMYGEYFSKRGFAFAASSMHGANWGSDQAVTDMKNSIDWIKGGYLIQDKIDILGFSMGGLPVFNFLFKYPNLVERVALLAPTSRDYSKSQFYKIRFIPIQIWHGDKDVNVPPYLSRNLITRNKSLLGFTNINLNILPNKGHFDIDTELRKEIYTFFADAS